LDEQGVEPSSINYLEADRFIRQGLIYQLIKRTPRTGSRLVRPRHTADRRTQLPIRQFLAGRAFDPELIQQMSAAFLRSCEALQLEPVDDPATRLVARTIIEFAEDGHKDASSLFEMTVQAFQAD
jgi:hypothetical protein